MAAELTAYEVRQGNAIWVVLASSAYEAKKKVKHKYRNYPNPKYCIDPDMPVSVCKSPLRGTENVTIIIDEVPDD